MPNPRPEPTVPGVLRKARELIADPARWTQGSYFRRGRESREARPGHAFLADIAREPDCQYCAVGALMAGGRLAAPGNFIVSTAARAVVDRVLSRRTTTALPTWNDDPARTHEEVLQLFDEAIAEAEDV